MTSHSWWQHSMLDIDRVQGFDAGICHSSEISEEWPRQTYRRRTSNPSSWPIHHHGRQMWYKWVRVRILCLDATRHVYVCLRRRTGTCLTKPNKWLKSIKSYLQSMWNEKNGYSPSFEGDVKARLRLQIRLNNWQRCGRKTNKNASCELQSHNKIYHRLVCFTVDFRC